MANVPGFLRRRERIDEAEFELAQVRTLARLAEMFGGTAASVEAPADLPAATEQPRAAQAPADPDPAVPTGRRGTSRRPPAIELPAHLVGVMAKPERPDVEAPPEPDATTIVGVMAGSGPTSAVEPAEDRLGRVDGFILGRAIVTPPVTVPVRAADAPVRDETGTAGRTQPTHDPGQVDLHGADPPVVEPAVASDVVADAGPSNRLKAVRGTPGPRPRKNAQVRGTRLRRAPAHRARSSKAAPAPPLVAASCPYCAALLQPPATSSRGCPRCRQRIVVRHLDGRAVYLTSDAVRVFDAERRWIASSGRWTRDRQRWLKLAAAAGAPGPRVERLAAALPSEDAVEAARTLYMTTVERTSRSAKADHRWEDASRIRHAQALALFRLAGSPVPPPEEIATLQRDAVVAELRSIAAIAQDAELVSAACCGVCLADAARTCRIRQELSAPTLPHQGCHKGLCRCRWDLTPRDRAAVGRYRTRAPTSVGSS
jgi:hypothetical protein